LLWLDNHIRADVIEATVRGVSDSFLGELPAMAQFGNCKIKLLVAQNLHLDTVLRGHRRLAAFLDPAVQGD
tara:strand:+ start:2404 stop:2616 length:213 start_codon:yes stop_codon:yes gene_type:complete